MVCIAHARQWPKGYQPPKKFASRNTNTNTSTSTSDGAVAVPALDARLIASNFSAKIQSSCGGVGGLGAGSLRSDNRGRSSSVDREGVVPKLGLPGMNLDDMVKMKRQMATILVTVGLNSTNN